MTKSSKYAQTTQAAKRGGIQAKGYLAEMYGTEVSPEFISKVTDEVAAEITAWQSRPLEPMYPVVFFDARDYYTYCTTTITVAPDGTSTPSLRHCVCPAAITSN